MQFDCCLNTLPDLATASLAPKSVMDKLRTILIANRGEIAVRIVRTAKRLGIRTISIYTSADAASLHVSTADVADCMSACYQLSRHWSMSESIWQVWQRVIPCFGSRQAERIAIQCAHRRCYQICSTMSTSKSFADDQIGRAHV